MKRRLHIKVIDPKGPRGDSYIGYCTYRGGSWGQTIRGCRVAARFSNHKPAKADYIGFRPIVRKK